MSNAAETRTIDQWYVVSPKHTAMPHNTVDKAMEVVKSMHGIGDPDYDPTHIVHRRTVTTVTEEQIALPSNRLTATDVVPFLREQLVKLGGNAPVGEDALTWAVEQTLSVLKASGA